MLADWETNAVLISDLLSQRYPEIVRQLEAALAEQEIPLIIVPETADIWIRDAAPIQVDDSRCTFVNETAGVGLVLGLFPQVIHFDGDAVTQLIEPGLYAKRKK